MRVRQRTVECQRWTSALLLSLCLLGTTGCGQGRQQEPQPTSPQTQTAQQNGQGSQTEEEEEEAVTLNLRQLQSDLSDSVSAQDYLQYIKDINAAYSSYINSANSKLLDPLKIIADKEAEYRTQTFIDGTQLDVEQVRADLNKLEEAIEAFSGNLEGLIVAQRIKKTEQVDLVTRELKDIQDAINEIQTSLLLDPLLPSEQSMSKNIFVNPSAVEEPAPKEGIPPHKSDIIKAIQGKINGLKGLPESNQGSYGEKTFGEIQKFLDQQNKIIEDAQIMRVASVLDLDKYGDKGNGGGDDLGIRRVIFPSVLALFAIGLSAWLFRKTKFKVPPNQHPNGIADPALGHSSTNKEIQALRREMQALASLDDLKSLKYKVQALEQAISNINAKIESSAIGVDIPSYLDSYATPSRQSSLTVDPRSNLQVPNYSSSRQAYYSPAEIYNQSPSQFNSVSRVALSPQSQEDLWAGKTVQPILIDSPQGDYEIITQNNSQFYIVLRGGAALSTSNIETFKVFYDFPYQQNLNSLRRNYLELAEVKAYGSSKSWALVRRGELSFI